MQRFFIWLSGADEGILAQCVKMPGSERRKFAGFGSLVLIPAILGLISMTFAVSTFTQDWRLCIGAGVVWAYVVITVDRFLVSTLFKSRVTTTRSFVGSLLYRLLFASFVGFLVADPLVLMIFSTATTVQAEDEQRKKKTEQLAHIQQSMHAAEAPRLKELTQKMDFRDCLMRAVSGESSGTRMEYKDREGRVCATTSGKIGFRQGYQDLQHQIKLLTGEISSLEDKQRNDIALVTKATSGDIEAFNGRIHTDYISRSRALGHLAQLEPRVGYIWWFLIVAFIFIDTLVISLKAFTSRGEYEEIRDSLLNEVILEQEAKRAAMEVWAKTGLKSSEEAMRQHAAVKADVVGIMSVTNEFLHAQESQRLRFEAQISAVAKNVTKVKDEEAKKIYTARLADIRDAFNEAWGKAMAKFNAYLRGL